MQIIKDVIINILYVFLTFHNFNNVRMVVVEKRLILVLNIFVAAVLNIQDCSAALLCQAII